MNILSVRRLAILLSMSSGTVLLAELPARTAELDFRVGRLEFVCENSLPSSETYGKYFARVNSGYIFFKDLVIFFDGAPVPDQSYVVPPNPRTRGIVFTTGPRREATITGYFRGIRFANGGIFLGRYVFPALDDRCQPEPPQAEQPPPSPLPTPSPEPTPPPPQPPDPDLPDPPPPPCPGGEAPPCNT